MQNIKLTGKQPAIELIQRDQSTDLRLHFHYLGTNELR